MHDEPFEPGKYLSMLIRSYAPNQYEHLLETRTRTFLAFFGILLGVTAILFSVTVLALTVRYVGELPQTLSPVQELRFSGDAIADAPVLLLDRPRVVLDMTVNGSETALTPTPDVLFTQGGVVYPRYVYAGSSFIAWSDVNDLKRESPLRDKLLRGAVLFLAPSLIFWGLAYHLGRVALIMLVMLALGYWVPRFARHHITGRETVKILTLSSPSLLLFGVGLSPLAPRPLFWWGLALTIALYAIGIALMSERRSPTWSERRDRKA